MSRKRPVIPLSKVLHGVLENLQPDTKLGQEEIEAVWERLAGKEAAIHSWPRRLTKGKLLVEVDSSGWLYTLNLKKQFLAEGLIELLGAERLRELSFRIGEKDAKKEQ